MLHARSRVSSAPCPATLEEWSAVLPGSCDALSAAGACGAEDLQVVVRHLPLEMCVIEPAAFVLAADSAAAQLARWVAAKGHAAC